jgi:hypothetical protein
VEHVVAADPGEETAAEQIGRDLADGSGQRQPDMGAVEVVEELRSNGALAHTAVLVADASEPAASSQATSWRKVA